jgi:hypothetical protein
MGGALVKRKCNIEIKDLKAFILTDRFQSPIFFIESCNSIDDLVVEAVSEIDIEVFQYSSKNYIEMREVKFEAELHFDGVTSPRLDRVPDVVIFEFPENPKLSSTNDFFYLVDGVRLAELLSGDIKSFLLENKLAIRGMRNKIRDDWDSTFEIPLLNRDYPENRILGHIPTMDLSKLSINDGWLCSSNEGVAFKFLNCTIEKSISVFFALHDLIKSNCEVTFSFMPQDGNVVIIDNKRIMHGRAYSGTPYKRLMRRTQLKVI